MEVQKLVDYFESQPRELITPREPERIDSGRVLYEYTIKLKNAHIVYGFQFCLQVIELKNGLYNYIISYKDNNQYESSLYNYTGTNPQDTATKAMIQGIDFCITGALFPNAKVRNGKTHIITTLHTKKVQLIEKQTILW